jgi:hypothetical protein
VRAEGRLLVEPDRTAIIWTRTLLGLSTPLGGRFPEEWKIVKHRVEVVHQAAVSHDVEPAGAPRLDVPDE